MDKSEALKVAREYAKEVKTKFAFDKMILFGSFAKGTFRDDSDIDIAVIFKDFDTTMDIQVQLMRMTRNINSRIEPFPFKAKEFNRANPLAYEILKYGEVIA